MTSQTLRTNDDIAAALRAAGGRVEILGTTVFDEPIWVGQFGSGSGEPVVITAGSHADEVAGVFAAIELAEALQGDRPVAVVPVRDPVGWNGFAHTLQRVLPDAPAVASHDDAARALRRLDVVFDDGHLVIADAGPCFFATLPATRWTSTEITRRRLPALLRESPDLAARLKGARILVPGNTEVEDGRTPYSYGGHTAYIGDGYAAQLNRFFDRDDGPVEVTALRALVDRLKPGLTLDLHEGFGASYYVFVHGESLARTHVYAAEMIRAVRQAGYPISTREELEPVWGPTTSAGIATVGDGVFAMGPPGADSHASFAGYCDQFGIALTTESGMEAPVHDRVAMITAASRAVIARFDNQ